VVAQREATPNVCIVPSSKTADWIRHLRCPHPYTTFSRRAAPSCAFPKAFTSTMRAVGAYNPLWPHLQFFGKEDSSEDAQSRFSAAEGPRAFPRRLLIRGKRGLIVRDYNCLLTCATSSSLALVAFQSSDLRFADARSRTGSIPSHSPGLGVSRISSNDSGYVRISDERARIVSESWGKITHLFGPAHMSQHRFLSHNQSRTTFITYGKIYSSTELPQWKTILGVSL
jgi:hypothetical protein